MNVLKWTFVPLMLDTRVRFIEILNVLLGWSFYVFYFMNKIRNFLYIQGKQPWVQPFAVQKVGYKFYK